MARQLMRRATMPRREAVQLVEFILDMATSPDAADGVTAAGERVLVALRANRFAVGWARDWLGEDIIALAVLDEAAVLLTRWALASKRPFNLDATAGTIKT